MHKIEEYINILDNKNAIDVNTSFEMLEACSSMIEKDSIFSRKLGINVLNNWEKIPETTKEAWSSVIETLGFYPYLNKENIELTGTSESLRRHHYDSLYLKNTSHHAAQRQILNIIFSEKNLIVSAPTSFGKSLIIEEIVASQKYKNIIVIQPTLALLDETRRKLKKYKDYYKLIVRTSQKSATDKGNIYLFTAERVNEYEFTNNIDFLIIDEFYKLSGSRDDERSASLNNAFYKTYWKFKPQFYFLGPNIDDVSKGFLDFYKAEFYKSDFSLIDSRSINVYEEYKNRFGQRGKKRDFTEKILFDLLIHLSNEQTIIYCSSPNRVRLLANKFTEYCKQNITNKKELFTLSEWIKMNISDKWMLLDALDYSIGIHDGTLQKHITTSIIDYFNSGRLKYLFCTSTIIEGVNTSAKNIIFFDNKKGGFDIDYFDYSNIKGRAGRMMQHYVGKIYNFHKPPQKTYIGIDIPIYDQNPIKDEVLIQIKPEHIKNKDSSQYKYIQSIPSDEYSIIKKNGISVKGQKKIIDYLMSNLPQQNDLFLWNTKNVDYKKLEAVLNLAWDNFIEKNETTRPMTKKKLIYFTWQYMLTHNEINLIKKEYEFLCNQESYKDFDEKSIYNIAIQDVFQIIRHWINYKVPKWLNVLNELQIFVCKKKNLQFGDYSILAINLENSYIPNNLSILLEYGIPASAIHKLKKLIPNEIEQDDVINYIMEKGLNNNKTLIEYEREKLEKNI